MKWRAWWISLPLVLAAAFWPLNWRLDHPLLSQSDRQLRAAIAGADRIEIRYMSCQQMACSANVLMKKSLTGPSMEHFRDDLRFLDAPTTAIASGSGRFVRFELFFWRGHANLAHLTLYSMDFTVVKGLKEWGNKEWENGRRLQPRFEKSLSAKLPTGDF